jgi:GT2 family glycosyltransferase
MNTNLKTSARTDGKTGTQMNSQTNSNNLIGIVTVLYNSDDVLPDFFTSLAGQTVVRFRLYVIDNSVTDTGIRISRTLADRHGIDVHLLFNNANVGVAKGNNQGIDLALADGCSHVLLANNDTQFAPDTICLLLDAVIGGADVVATPKIMYHGEPTRLWYGGGHIDAWRMLTPHDGMKEIDYGQYNNVRHVGYAPTCFMMFDAAVFARTGRMDEQFFVYYDDTDFVWRMNALGIRIRFVPESVVLHKVSTSTGGDRSPFSLYYTNRNRVYFIRKNLQGVPKLVALCYMLTTRCVQTLLLPRAQSARLWKGVRDGFSMHIPEPVGLDTAMTRP